MTVRLCLLLLLVTNNPKVWSWCLPRGVAVGIGGAALHVAGFTPGCRQGIGVANFDGFVGAEVLGAGQGESQGHVGGPQQMGGRGPMSCIPAPWPLL